MHLTAAQRSALDVLARDLESVFAGRLTCVLAYTGHRGDDTIHSLAVIQDVRFRDLAACVPLVAGWHRYGLGVPLMLSSAELDRTLDIFPLEYASIIADHIVIRGDSPFAGVEVPVSDVRRACEAQAKSHLIHLREGFLESNGVSTAIAALIASSASPFRTLLLNIARLPDGAGSLSAGHLPDPSLADLAEKRIGISAALVRDVFAAAAPGRSAIADPSALLARYMEATARVWQYVDAWKS